MDVCRELEDTSRAASKFLGQFLTRFKNWRFDHFYARISKKVGIKIEQAFEAAMNVFRILSLAKYEDELKIFDDLKMSCEYIRYNDKYCW